MKKGPRSIVRFCPRCCGNVSSWGGTCNLGHKVLPIPGPRFINGEVVALPSRRKVALDRALRFAATIATVGLLAGVFAYKMSFIEVIRWDPFFVTYGLVVLAYISSRFGLSLFYRPVADAGHEPTVAIIMPAFNEAEAIGDSLASLIALDYPRDKLELIVVNDGSTDGTLLQFQRAAARDPRIRIIDFTENRGKRVAMSAAMRTTSAEIIVFVDSDCTVEPDGLRALVQPFAQSDVGAVAGHADVANVKRSWVTRMQTVRYFVAFRVVKAAESITGAVTCCSGCFSGYRREAVMPILEQWENQSFLGTPSTYGDDRSLTNFVLRKWKVLYQSTAVSRTIAPETTPIFLRQQMRWKRSWTRESTVISRFVWRKNPVAAVSVYVGIALNLLGPMVAIRALAWRPLVEGRGFPIVYLIGILVMALIYGLYYGIRKGFHNGIWAYGAVFVIYYITALLWQTYYAILTCRSASWGTRSSTLVSKAERVTTTPDTSGAGAPLAA